jgi:hypothetical protein
MFRQDRQAMTDPQETAEITGKTETTEIMATTATDAARTQEVRIPETDVTSDSRAAVLRVREQTTVIRTGEVQKMADLRATGKTDFRDLLGRIRKVVRAAAGITQAAQAITEVLEIMTAAQEAMKDREISSEITEIPSRARALLRKQAEKIWRRSARKTRGVSVRRRISAPRKTISMRKKKQ